MERVYKYKEFVDKPHIKVSGEDDNKRYLLEIPLKNKSETQVLVILKNPSKADRNFSDLTIDRVLTFCYNEGYGRVYITNLFSYYSTNPGGITKLIDSKKYLDAVGSKNDSTLKEALEKVDEVIVAWGGNTIRRKFYYTKRINEVVALIKNKKLFYVQSVSRDGYYPRHAQCWSVRQGIEKYIWIPPK